MPVATKKRQISYQRLKGLITTLKSIDLFFIKNLTSEAPLIIKDSRPPKDWPQEGAISYKRVRMRYRNGLPLVLKGMSFDVKPREKIGIVGRTGSGE